jgi:hypothetical protein
MAVYKKHIDHAAAALKHCIAIDWLNELSD